MGSGYGTSTAGYTSTVTTYPTYAPATSSVPASTGSGYGSSRSPAPTTVTYPITTGGVYGETSTKAYPIASGSGYGAGKSATSTVFPAATGSGYGSSTRTRDYGDTIGRSISEIDPVTRQQIQQSSRLKIIDSVYQLQVDPVIEDLITTFKPTTDVLAFNINDLPPGFAKPKLKVVKSKKQLEKALKSTNNYLIYDLSTGNLILDTNGRASGFGDDGGIIAIIAGSARISRDNIAFYSE